VFVRTIISEKGFPVRDDVDIRGYRLQEALLELNKETEGFSFHQDPPKVTFETSGSLTTSLPLTFQ
jgi:hypothetical protein